jgi:hypothetical protein
MESLPKEFKSSLPTVEEIEVELEKREAIDKIKRKKISIKPKPKKK